MPSRSWQFRIDDIIEAINKIERYTHGIDFASWQNDEKTVDAERFEKPDRMPIL